jgi:hypothetical protein
VPLVDGAGQSKRGYFDEQRASTSVFTGGGGENREEDSRLRQTISPDDLNLFGGVLLK